MINDIKEMLSNGENVELECIDMDGFLDSEFSQYDSMIINGSLVVTDVNDDGVLLSSDHRVIITEDLKYFRIKREVSLVLFGDVFKFSL